MASKAESTQLSDSESADAADAIIKDIQAKVGDVVVFDLPLDETKVGTQQWIFVEDKVGRSSDIYVLTNENMKVNDDMSRTYSFTLEITGSGDDILTFINGDVTKIDDAMDSYESTGNIMFSVEDMEGKEYCQVRIKASN